MNLIAVVSNNFDAFITVIVLIMSIILFIRNTIAPELTGLLCVGIFITTGVLSPEKALAGFGSPSLITLMGLFAVSSALFKSGALDRVRELISSESIRTPRKLISLIAFLIAPISGIVPNTPVVASLLPLIETWCERRNISPSKVLLPLSFATLLGGTLTLLGSSVNLLVSDISQQLGYGGLELFSLTSIGIPVWLIGISYMILVSDMLLPDRGRDKEFIKNGNELVRPLQNELRLIMWKYCGVIKNETLLLEGLSKIENIKIKLSDVDVRIDKYNCEDLALIFDLQSSLFSAKATIVSALQRNESRGAHQRSDFPLLDSLSQFNCVVSMDDNNNLKISKVPIKELNKQQKIIVANAKREEDIRNKLLE